MPVPIADSVGYEGTVTEPEWAELIASAGGRQYGVLDENAWRARIGSADREVRISPGAGFGWGVLDRTSEDASLVLPAAPSGSVWHLLTAHRDWQNNETSFDTIAAGAARAIPSRATVPGTADDQPIALARVDAGKSQVQEIVDLRVWGSDGGSFAKDELVLQYLNRLGTTVQIGDVLARRVLNQLGTPVWRRYDLTEDTGWVDVTRNNGWQWGISQVRRIGAVVFYRFSALRPQGWAADGELAIIPAGFRPSQPHYALSSHGRGRTEFGIQTNGRVLAVEPSNGAAGVTLMGSYPV